MFFPINLKTIIFLQMKINDSIDGGIDLMSESKSGMSGMSMGRGGGMRGGRGSGRGGIDRNMVNRSQDVSLYFKVFIFLLS